MAGRRNYRHARNGQVYALEWPEWHVNCAKEGCEEHALVAEQDDRSEGFLSEWQDEIVVGIIRRNKDGSITVSCCINVYAENGVVYGIDGKEIRLPRKKR